MQEKEEDIKLIVSKRKEIRIRAEGGEIVDRNSTEKIVRPKATSLKRSVKIISL